LEEKQEAVQPMTEIHVLPQFAQQLTEKQRDQYITMPIDITEHMCGGALTFCTNGSTSQDFKLARPGGLVTFVTVLVRQTFVMDRRSKSQTSMNCPYGRTRIYFFVVRCTVAEYACVIWRSKLVQPETTSAHPCRAATSIYVLQIDTNILTQHSPL
jgi:hypothetical protein